MAAPSRAQATSFRRKLAGALLLAPEAVGMEKDDNRWLFFYEYDAEVLWAAHDEVQNPAGTWSDRVNGATLALYRK